MALDETLNRFKELAGFLGVGVFTRGGELISATASGAMEMDMVGALVTNLVTNAHLTAEELGLGGSDQIDVRTSAGANIYIRSHGTGGQGFFLILICTQEAQPGMVHLRLNQFMPLIPKELGA